MSKIIRVEIYEDNVRTGLIQLSAVGNYAKKLKDWFERQEVLEDKLNAKESKKC